MTQPKSCPYGIMKMDEDDRLHGWGRLVFLRGVGLPARKPAPRPQARPLKRQRCCSSRTHSR